MIYIKILLKIFNSLCGLRSCKDPLMQALIRLKPTFSGIFKNAKGILILRNLHEPVRGHYDFSDRLNLAHFLELASKFELDVIV